MMVSRRDGSEKYLERRLSQSGQRGPTRGELREKQASAKGLGVKGNTQQGTTYMQMRGDRAGGDYRE